MMYQKYRAGKWHSPSYCSGRDKDWLKRDSALLLRREALQEADMIGISRYTEVLHRQASQPLVYENHEIQ